MDDSCAGQTTDTVLGQEFLTWLWFRSENHPLGFQDKNGSFTVAMEQRIVVQGGEGEALETATVAGSMSPQREARLGLRTGKKVIRALVRFERDELSWQVTLKAEDFSFGSFRTPKVEHDPDDDPDALFLEKMYLMETCLGFIDLCYREFITLRLSSSGWNGEVRDMAAWMAAERQ